MKLWIVPDKVLQGTCQRCLSASLGPGVRNVESVVPLKEWR